MDRAPLNERSYCIVVVKIFEGRPEGTYFINANDCATISSVVLSEC